MGHSGLTIPTETEFESPQVLTGYLKSISPSAVLTCTLLRIADILSYAFVYKLLIERNNNVDEYFVILFRAEYQIDRGRRFEHLHSPSPTRT